MKYKYLNSDGNFPRDMDWDADIQVISHMEKENPNNQVQVNSQNLGWKDALYQDDSDFQELIEQGWSNGYHEKLNRYLLVNYAFSNCRVDPELGITIRGQLHPATREPGGDCYTDESQTLASATIVVQMKSSRTENAIREYLEGSS